MICTSRRDQHRLFTCTANSSRADAMDAADRLSRTETFTSRQPRFHGANAAAGFARISAGLAKCRSNWIASLARWANARSSWLWARRVLLSQRPASSLMLVLVLAPEPSTPDPKNPPTHRRSPHVIWGKLVSYCLSCLGANRFAGRLFFALCVESQSSSVIVNCQSVGFCVLCAPASVVALLCPCLHCDCRLLASVTLCGMPGWRVFLADGRMTSQTLS